MEGEADGTLPNIVSKEDEKCLDSYTRGHQGLEGGSLRVSEEHQKWGGRQNHTELSERGHTER